MPILNERERALDLDCGRPFKADAKMLKCGAVNDRRLLPTKSIEIVEILLTPEVEGVYSNVNKAPVGFTPTVFTCERSNRYFRLAWRMGSPQEPEVA